MEYLEELRLLVIDMVIEMDAGKAKARLSLSGTDEQESTLSGLAQASRSKVTSKKNVSKPSEGLDRSSRRSTSVSKGDRRRSSADNRSELKFSAEIKIQAQEDDNSVTKTRETMILENLSNLSPSVLLPRSDSMVDINSKQDISLVA